MFLTPVLQRSEWRFDWRSALIGALVAWVIAAIIYRQRAALGDLAQRLWAPVKRWRARMKSSVEEKYLRALQEALSQLLLFAPQDPTAVFVPPIFLAPPPLPNTFSDETLSAAPVEVPFSTLRQGHPRVIITGAQGDGRTTTLALTAWALVPDDEGDVPFERFPLWIDLARLEALPAADSESSPVEFLTELATRFLPRALPKWILEQLRTQPPLILVDNWEALPREMREPVAHWIAEVGEALPEAHWLVATGPEGYGPLVEGGFVPVEITPVLDETALHKLFTGWASLREREETLEGESLHTLLWAREAGDQFLELTARTLLYLQTEQLPYQPTEVFAELLELQLPIPKVSEEWPEGGEEAQRLAFKFLEELAFTIRIEGERVTPAWMEEQLEALMPPETERPPRFEATVQQLLQKSRVMQRAGDSVHFSHYLWRDFFAARALAERENGVAQLLDHLYDSEWLFLLECFIGLGQGEKLVKSLIKDALAENDRGKILRAGRWAVVAPPSAGWRKAVMKILAQTFVKPEMEDAERLAVGRALALIAGETARPFFLQTLRTPQPGVRASALRGLGWTGTPSDMKIIAAGINDSNFNIQVSAVRALGDLGTSGAFRLLQRFLAQSDEQLIITIAETLASQPEGWEALQEATQSEDLMVRRAAAHALGYVPQPWAEELLGVLVREDPQWLVRSAAEASLTALQAREEAATVAPPPKIDEAGWLMNWAARQGLGLGVGEAALQTLLHALERGEPETRILAALTLMRMGRREHLELLRPLLEDPNVEVQGVAAEAYATIEMRYRGLEALPEG